MLLGLIVVFLAQHSHLVALARSKPEARPKQEALRAMIERSLLKQRDLEAELESLDYFSGGPPATILLDAPYVNSELRQQPARYRQLRPLSDDLVKELPAWRARGLEELPKQGFDPSFYPAHCWRAAVVVKTLCLPGFFVIGTPKAGTTALWNYLTSHPDVVKVRKEPHWWSQGSGSIVPNYIRANYMDVASKLPRGLNRTFGDGSASYLWYLRHLSHSRRPLVPEMLHAALPRARLIVLLREPTSRLISEFGYFSPLEKIDSRSFDKAANEALNDYALCATKNNAFGSASSFCAFETLKGGKEAPLRLGVGLYASPLTVWLSIWGFEQILVLRAEDLRCNPDVEMASVFRHIRVIPERYGRSSTSSWNEREPSRRFEVHSDTLAKLVEFYRPHNRQLAALLGDKRFLWQDDPCTVK